MEAAFGVASAEIEHGLGPGLTIGKDEPALVERPGNGLVRKPVATATRWAVDPSGPMT